MMSLSFLGAWAGAILLVREGGPKPAAGRKEGKSSCLEVSGACQTLLQG